MNIDNVIKALIAREGGFSNRATDRGGPTKYGITQHTLSLWLAREVDVDDVRNLYKSTAYEIYYSWYYIKPGINQLPPLIQPVMLDMTANHGQKNAIKMLQDALTSHGHACGKIDGKIGDKTIAAASKAEAEMGNDLLRALVNRRKIFMEAIVRNDETQREYLSGWLARAESFLPVDAAEVIKWIDVHHQLPDDDMTVLIHTPTQDEPTAVGYHHQKMWYYPSGHYMPYEAVKHWAEMPGGPKVAA